jgi:hypothetical protein
MLTDKEKSDLLNQVVDLLNEADRLQQLALGDCDVCWDNHEAIQGIADDIVCDIVELDELAAQEKA